MTSRISESCQSGLRPSRRARTRGSPGARAARARAGRRSDGSRAVRRAPRGSPPASRGARRPPAGRRTAASRRRPSASSVAIASSWRPAALTARWRFADSALRTRLSSPRRARETWRASTSSRAPDAPIRRRKVPDRLPVLGGHHAPPATDAPRDGQPELGQPRGQLRRRGRLDDELEMGPAAGQAERATGEEPAAQPGRVAVFRGRSPRRTAAPALPFPDRPRRCASRATDASRPVGAGPRPSTSATRSQGRDGSMAASSSRRAVTRSRSDRVTRRPPPPRRRPATPARSPQALRLAVRPVVRRRIPASPSKARMIAAASRAGSWWWGCPGPRRRRG